jgi:phosphate transport system ATP-binding protein
MDMATSPPVVDVKIQVCNLNFFYGPMQALMDINIDILSKKVTALIGPSGCANPLLAVKS